MKIKAVIALLICLVLSGCSATNAPTWQEGKLKVCASFYPMYDFAVKIGGDKADVKTLVPAGTEPHDWEPSVSDIVTLENADIFIYNGAGMESWTDRVLSSLKNKQLIALEASKGVPLLTGSGETAASDAHVWLSPQNAKTELSNIKDTYIQADPANASVYEANYQKYAAAFDALDKKYRDTLAACPKKDIVVSHEAFGYLCAAYGLHQYALEGLQADSEPDPARMAEIINFVNQNNVKVIFSEELLSPKVAEAVAKETGARTEVLSPVEGLSDDEIKAGEDYISVMEKNLNKLKEALE
jgi:zinc transport system substrate-binding protein